MSPASAPRGDRLALHLVQLGALAVVLVALPYKAFDLDRYFVPKELALHVTALLAALACLLGRKRLSLAPVDLLLVAYLLLSFVSAALATNWWLAGRALAISLSGAALFWVGRALGRYGLTRSVLLAAGFAATIGAATALLQTYGVQSQYFSLSRVPGGTFGNRNFVGHIGAIGLPVLLYCTLTARRGVGALFGAIEIAVVAAALVLSRSRAAWLAVALSLAPLALLALLLRSRWRDQGVGGRVVLVAATTAVTVLLAVFLPNTLNWKSESPYLESVRGVVNYKQGSGHGRLIQYTNSLHMTQAHPVLGVGPGNWSVVYPRYASRNDPSLDSDGMTANPWPSSDMMAFLSERGAPAFAALVLFILALLLNAAAQVWRGRTAEQLFRGLALGGTVVATMVVGGFDAVLLLAAPSLIAWTVFGALIEPRRVEVFALDGAARDWALVVVFALGALAILHSSLQIGAMRLFTGATRVSTMETASMLDPGDYRIRVRLAQAWMSRGSCPRALPHARRAHDLFPHAPEPRQLLASCGERVRSR